MPARETGALRMTQGGRRERTRRLLLDATISSLADLGYSGTTTLEVERRAGISRGARVHHFPSKAELLASAVDALYAQLSDHYAEAFAQAHNRRTERQRLRAGLRLIWAIYRKPEYSAAIALNVEARTDAELRERLQSVATRHRDLAVTAAQAFFPSVSRARAESVIETIQAAFVGLRMHYGVIADERHVEMVLGTLEDFVISHLEASAKSSRG